MSVLIETRFYKGYFKNFFKKTLQKRVDWMVREQIKLIF